jgi:hypothetical protein
VQDFCNAKIARLACSGRSRRRDRLRVIIPRGRCLFILVLIQTRPPQAQAKRACSSSSAGALAATAPDCALLRLAASSAAGPKAAPPACVARPQPFPGAPTSGGGDPIPLAMRPTSPPELPIQTARPQAGPILCRSSHSSRAHDSTLLRGARRPGQSTPYGIILQTGSQAVRMSGPRSRLRRRAATALLSLPRTLLYRRGSLQPRPR